MSANPSFVSLKVGSRGCFYLLSLCVRHHSPGDQDHLQTDFGAWNIHKCTFQSTSGKEVLLDVHLFRGNCEEGRFQRMPVGQHRLQHLLMSKKLIVDWRLPAGWIVGSQEPKITPGLGFAHPCPKDRAGQPERVFQPLWLWFLIPMEHLWPFHSTMCCKRKLLFYTRPRHNC